MSFSVAVFGSIPSSSGMLALRYSTSAGCFSRSSLVIPNMCFEMSHTALGADGDGDGVVSANGEDCVEKCCVENILARNREYLKWAKLCKYWEVEGENYRKPKVEKLGMLILGIFAPGTKSTPKKL